MPNIQFAVQSYRHSSLPVSSQRTLNCYAEQQPPDAKTQVALLGSPGLVQFAEAGVGPVRGLTVMGGVLYAVSGGTLYSIASNGTATALGGTVSGTGPVSIDNNGTQICIVNGTSGYIWTSTGGFQLITDADFNAASTVTFLDQYFVFDWASTNKFFISALLDGTSFSALDFASAESRPDNVVAVTTYQENLVVFGNDTTEVHFNTGAANFPFQRVDGGTVERGIAAPLAFVKEEDAIYFLGDDRIFYQFGRPPRRVSTHAIESAWQAYGSITDAFAFSYTFEGHKFIVLTFPGENVTWQYDIATGMWQERESRDGEGRALGRWRGNCHARCYGKELIGDAFSGKIGYLDRATFTEYGNTMIAEAVSAPIHSDRKRVFMSRLELDVETGVGITSGQGSDPQLMLNWSDDGGRTFSQLQPWNSMGKAGEYRTRLRWLRMGSFFSRVLKVTISDPVRRTIIAAHADLKQGL